MIYHNHNNGVSGDEWEGSIGHLRDFHACVKDSAAALERHCKDFDTIIATGMSGVLVAAPLAVILGKDLTVLRKPEDSAHQRRPSIEGTVIGSDSCHRQRVLILDDFVSMGDTHSRLKATVKALGGTHVATYMYQPNEYQKEG